MVFNIMSGIFDIFALLICSGLLCLIIYRSIRIRYNRNRIINDVSLILSINIICIILLKSILQLMHVTIPTLLKDFYVVIEWNETLFYRLRAYVLWSMITVLNWSYGLLAFFRFVRVIYPMKLWLHRSSFYLYILIPSQFILAFVCFLPVWFIFDSFHQIPNEVYCSILPIPVISMIYVFSIVYGVSFDGMLIFYYFIVRKMRQIRQTSVLRQNSDISNRRDIIVFRRMLFNLLIIVFASVPFCILYVIGYIKNYFDIITYRTQWLLSSFSSCMFSWMLPVITTQLNDFLRPNRVIPIQTNT